MTRDSGEQAIAGEGAPDDLEILAKAAASGDPEAFRALVDATHATVYRVALRVVGDTDEAADVTQETFVRAWQKLASLREHAAVRGWLCRIARNLATDRTRWRARRKHRSLDEVGDEGLAPLVERLCSDDPGPEEQLASAQLGDALRRVLDGLSEKHRVVLLLREVDGMSYEEIAAALDCPVGTVESRLHRAREALARRLEKSVKRA
jgi:RNA polymerase sigma-70 factor, ECF subfamily